MRKRSVSPCAGCAVLYVSGSGDGDEKVGSAILERVLADLDRVLAAPASLSSFEKRDLLRSLLLFGRFSRDRAASDSMQARVDRLRACLSTQDQAPVGGSGSGRTEREVFEVVERALSSQPGCTVERNVWLDGCFEADIVITLTTLLDGSESKSESRSERSVFNLEVDGPSHSLPTSQRLCRLRDQHLVEACGVRTARVPLQRPTGEWLRSAEVEAAVRAELHRWQLLPA